MDGMVRRPEEITSLVQMVLKHQSKSVVGRRIKRSGVIFRSMYEIYKLITFIFTGVKIIFNHSCLTKRFKIIVDKKVCGVVFQVQFLNI